MSSNYVTPGQQYDHLMMLVGGYHPDYILDARGRLSTDVDLTVFTPHSGHVVHPSALRTATLPGTGYGPNLLTFAMGCIGTGGKFPPIWLVPGAYDFDISNKGTPSGVPAVGQTGYSPNWYSALPGASPAVSESLWGVLGIQHLAAETTEYDTDQTYTTGQYLRAVTLNDNANSGKITNQNASSGGGAFANTAAITAPGTDTVVAMVNSGEFKNANDRQVLGIYTHYVHGTR